MEFLGIDLSATRVAVARFGEGVPVSKIYDGGSCKREDHEARIGRACRIAGALNEFLKPFESDRVIAIESPSCAQRGARAGTDTGEVFGLCLRVLVSHASSRWFMVHALHLKQFATGQAKAEKDTIRLAVFRRWSFEAESNDEVDAYVLAQMARCVVQPSGYTLQQQDVVAKCFLSAGKKPIPKNLQFVSPILGMVAGSGYDYTFREQKRESKEDA